MSTEHDHGQEGPIITFTDAARQKVLEVLDSQNLRDRGAIRVSITGRAGSGFNHAMGLEDDPPKADDTVVDEGEFKVYVDANTLPDLRGATVDFVEQLMGGGFRVDNPNPAWDDPLAAGIQQLLDREVNPGVASHGGHVDLIDVKDNKVYLRLGGGCQGCGMVDVTLRQGIEVLLKRAFPQVESVVDTTDHAGGTNPYYQPSKGGAGASPMYQPSKG